MIFDQMRRGDNVDLLTLVALQSITAVKDSSFDPEKVRFLGRIALTYIRAHTHAIAKIICNEGGGTLPST